MGLKAHILMKRNIDALLHARGHKRKELAAYCRRSESWLSQIFVDDERNIPLKYLDRIADFFGIETYQLFQPGIPGSALERRAGRDRRTGLDRRRSSNHAVTRHPTRTPDMETVTPGERALLARIRRLKNPEDRQHLEWMLDRALLHQQQSDEPSTGAPHGPPGPVETPAETAPRSPKRKRA